MYCTNLGTGTQVRFRLGNVVCPDTDQLFNNIINDFELDGKIVYFSDSGEAKDYYAIVEVKGVTMPLVIPVQQLEIGMEKMTDLKHP